MSPLKASGEDGLRAVFYQRFWHILGDEVAGYCISFLNGEFPINLINHMHIVLIPKVKSPRSMMNFHPLSLCNVLYKIASKALVNRFQEVLQFCIDEAQSAFVSGRLLSNNIVAAYEIFHSMKNRRFGMGNRLDVERIWGVHHADNWEKYLGLPCMVGWNKKWAFVSLRDKSQSQISS
ncbi:uncharacterized protein LOC105775646 [Gossypium raimondii]|uniref:uncharacterized protein LOC105775646 n=1 Tax=Gossypium raimondii TaxID=29730 RepID=UPI00063ADDA4|nr:uncharacterized protein LOC105775646 [Gossypium raimondii]